MTRIDRELLLSKIQDAERKYKSVAKAPPCVLADIQALTAVTEHRAVLTKYELNIMKRQFNGEMSMTEAATKMGHSTSWYKARAPEVKVGNYRIMEDKLDE
ncbi:hypothetical protein RA086_05495 [Lactiplantibacillus sp. WILCCON 0030]|uniref:Uncharacterized protein n=1 Tax=Lactiplantibacillus brownii TaxID=3069269 RepID=A0ABU1A878_9LACO|nr:hypothetical protein [Lactiplantibacillus brownii]MDQ7937081.1 hypothetical protein [Lactiplantibacillus brownii]